MVYIKFGLIEDDLNNDDFILKFSILDEIEGKKSVVRVGTYKDKELEYIRKNNPLTQLSTSDKQSSVDEKVNTVQNKMKELGFK